MDCLQAHLPGAERLPSVPSLYCTPVVVFAGAADSGTINYLAILDTAGDVAKAMLHLHSLNVLHSDL